MGRQQPDMTQMPISRNPQVLFFINLLKFKSWLQFPFL
jgi:hypothetical protein